LQDSFVSPAEIYSFDLTTSNLINLTSFNDLSSIDFSTPESVNFTNRDGVPVQSWIFPPYNFTNTSSYSVAVLIHGGPQGAWLDSFSYRWNPQVFAAAGYAVIAINPHGSTGFGQNYTDAIQGNWGGTPYYDILSVYDQAMSKYSWMKNESACALGASYGGYMMNWIHGQADRGARFKCLVNHDGVFDTFYTYYATDELWFPEHEFFGPPYEQQSNYTKYTPASWQNIKNWNLPTLVIHGGKDYRLVIDEGIATFTALQRQGIESKLLYFPRENHWVLKPSNSIIWHHTVLGWLNKHLP